jgi:hypothetical protein
MRPLLRPRAFQVREEEDNATADGPDHDERHDDPKGPLHRRGHTVAAQFARVVIGVEEDLAAIRKSLRAVLGVAEGAVRPIKRLRAITASPIAGADAACALAQ